MRSLRFEIVLFPFLLTVPLWSQAPSLKAPPLPPPVSVSDLTGPNWVPHPARDPKALEIVQASINAMGGAAVIGQAQGYAVQGQVQPAPGVKSAEGSVVWTVLGTEFRSDFSDARGTATLASGHGKPFNNANGTVTSRPPYTVRPLFVPPLVASALLKQLQDKNSSIMSGGTGKVDSVPVAIVKTVSQATQLDARLTQQTWYFDSSTGLPVRMEYRLPDVKVWTRYLSSTLVFSNYQSIAGILYPQQVIRSINGHQLSVLKIASVTTNPNVAPSFFDPPAGGVQ